MTAKPAKVSSKKSSDAPSRIRKSDCKTKTGTTEASISTGSQGRGQATLQARHARNEAAAGSEGSSRNRQAEKAIATGITTEPVPERASKKAVCLRLLGRDEGASIGDLMQATGWQAHSVRGFLSGEVRKRLGRELRSAVTGEGDRRYRLTDLAA